MFLRNLKVAHRSALGFGLIGLIVLVLGLFSLLQMQNIRTKGQEVDSVWMPSIATLSSINQQILRTRIHTLRLVLISDPAVDATTRAELKTFHSELQTLEDSYAKRIRSDEERALFASYQASRKGYYVTLDEIAELERQQRLDEAVQTISTKLVVGGDELRGHLAKLTAFNDQGADQASSDAAKMYDSAIVLTVVIIAVATLLTFGLALLFTRSIVQPLKQAVQVAETIATGDLSQSLTISGADEPARLLEALKRMQGNLRDTISRIASSSDQLASAAEELHAVTEDATRGLQQQTNELEQAATAVNEMTTAVDEVARNAVNTAEASREADKAARQGREQVLRTVESISLLGQDVTTSSAGIEQLAARVRDISQVLDVIRGVAEQTNLLALNAAIEAARAGEAGRGFAVVADEVRSLAHRTQQSTQEIEQMIGGIQQGTEQAVGAMQNSNGRARAVLDVARASGDALEIITEAMARISERNMVIASASEEQAQVSREVDRNLVNIRDLALQTSAGANQTNVASQELSRLAADLNTLISRFRV